MRVIAGEFRGRTLLAPVGDATRPITDRAKQSLFDILTPMIPEARVYDCFAGTGSMGLECLSRGAAHVTFFESDRSAAARLKQNITALGVTARATIVTIDIFTWFTNNPAPGDAIDIVFLDPPYRYVREKPVAMINLEEQMVSRYLAKSGIVVFRHASGDELELPALVRYDQRAYGEMVIDFLRRG